MRPLPDIAHNDCPHCHGTGKRPHPSVGFKLHVGDIVEDHCGLQVRIDEVMEERPETGWGTTLNASLETGILSQRLDGNVNHSYHRVETNNHHYVESLWKVVKAASAILLISLAGCGTTLPPEEYAKLRKAEISETSIDGKDIDRIYWTNEKNPKSVRIRLKDGSFVLFTSTRWSILVERGDSKEDLHQSAEQEPQEQNR